MDLKYFLFFVPFVTTIPSSAQECADGRYRTDLFTEVQVTTNVEFGSNLAVGGGTQTLFMDVYEPQGDALAERPVVLVAFGGSFVAGNRSDVAAACEAFARRGFVAVAPDYRIGFFLPNALTTTMAVLRGAHDMKACVRFLRSTITEGENPYRLDGDRILVGGFSAGAISALHATYLDQATEWPAVLADQYATLGGVEGNSGSPTFSSDVMAVFSFSGALGDSTWIQSGDQPVCSVHEVGDGVVPYYTQEVSVFGIPTGLVASGSHDVHERADHLQLDNCLLTYPGSGHVDYVNSDPVNSIGFVLDFCADLVCGEQAACGNVMAAVQEPSGQRLIQVHPNPAHDMLWVDGAVNTTVTLYDGAGQLVRTESIISDHHPLALTDLPEGLYILHGLSAQPVKLVHLR